MAISNSTLLLGGAGSFTGGTSKTFTLAGETITNGIKVVDLSIADSRLRTALTCINRPAKLNALGVYTSKDKKTLKLVRPKLRADGTISFPLREVRIEDDPEMTDAEKAELNSYTAQLLVDPDFQQFVLNGATA